MAQSDHYTYSPIDLSTDAIRLLRLSRGSKGDKIQCDIFEAFLHDIEGVPYSALSYTWGDSDSELFEINVGGKKAMVRENLHSALRCLRRQDQDRVLWIDAVCIDQGNHKERGHQVGQMRQVYELADEVIVWLGQSTDDIELLMELVNKLHKRVIQRPDYRRNTFVPWEKEWALLLRELGGMETSLNIRRRNALVNLLSRSWFRRVWILQEVFNSKNAVVQCGSMTARSVAFVAMPALMDVKPSSHAQAVLDIMPGCLRAGENSWWRSRPQLIDLLKRFQSSEASDPRDKIYALLGISSNTNTDYPLKPNYELTLRQVIRQTILYLTCSQSFTGPELEAFKALNCSYEEFLANLDRIHERVLEWAFTHGFERTATMVVSKSLNHINTHILVNTISTTALRFLAGQQGFISTIEAIQAKDLCIYQTHTTEAPTTEAPTTEASLPDALTTEALVAFNVAMISGNLAMVEKISSLASVCKQYQKHHYLQEPLEFVRRHYDRFSDVPESLWHNNQAAIIELLRDNLEINPVLDFDENGAQAGVCHPLYIATNLGLRDIVGELVNKGHEVDAKNGRRQETALYGASRRGQLDMVRTLLDKGADIEALSGQHGERALYAACISAHTDVVRALLNHYADRNAKNGNLAQTALYAAVARGHHEIVQMLIRAGADRNTKALDGTSALWKACEMGYYEIVQMLIRAGADVNTKAPDGTSALWKACEMGHHEILQPLIRARADRNTKAPDGTSALWKACEMGYYKTVQILIYVRADVNTKTPDGTSALWKACEMGHYAIVQMLIRARADVNAKASDGISALWKACEMGHYAIVQMLIRARADVNAKASDGTSALWKACEIGNYRIVEMLISMGADINAKASDGTSALWKACEIGNPTIVEMLIDAGADFNAKASDNRSPLQIARDNGHTKLEHMLNKKVNQICMRIEKANRASSSPLEKADFDRE